MTSESISQAQSAIEMIAPTAIEPMTKTARDRTWQAVSDIRALIRSGMTEKEAIKLANAYFAQHGVRKFWHKTHIRFGESTIMGFDDPYLDDVVLKPHDIFYIDVGPVWNGIEGDCGETFVVGDNLEYSKIASDVKVLFERVRNFWRETSLTGVELYEYADKIVQDMGYVLHPSYVKGHRLSEFSHFAYSNQGLGDMTFRPSAERWVLEFQICHPSMKFGAFYEDLLIS